MNRIVVYAIAIFLFLPNFVTAQELAVWKGLSFDQATTEDAVRAAGKPKKQRIEKMKVVSELNGPVVGTEEIQILEFEKIDEWKKVALGFMKGKLFKAKFWPKNKTLSASQLSERYKINFVAVEGLAKGVPLSVFEGQKEPEVPRVYPAIYYMISATPDRYTFVTINNGSWKTLWKDAFGKPTVNMFPGFVEDIEIISRHSELK